MISRFFRLTILLTAAAAAASADIYNWGDSYAQAWQGFATGPYTAISATTSNPITVFCMDFNDSIAPPFTWKANIWTLNQSNVQSEAQYGGNYNNLMNNAYAATNPGQPAPNQITAAPFAFVTDDAGGGYVADLTNSPDAYSRYLEAAWLFSELLAAGSQSHLDVVAQAAAWDLFVNPAMKPELTNDILATNANGNIYGFEDLIDPSGSATPSVSGLNFEQAVDYALNAAQSAVVTNKTFTGSGWSIVTGDPNWVESSDGLTIPAQEFLSPDSGGSSVPAPTAFDLVAPAPVPEPTAIVLLATAAWMMVVARRRKAS